MAKLKQWLYDELNKALQLVPLKIMDTPQSLEYMLKNSVSLCRFGEGEINLLSRKHDLKFQKYDEQLAARMKEILKSNDPEIAVAIPYALKNRRGLNERAAAFWNEHVGYAMVDWLPALSMGKLYLDALMTRCYIDLADRTATPKYYEAWKSLWHDRDLLIIEGEKSRLGVGNDLFENARSIRRILCPATNAFSRYNEILAEAQKAEKSDLILIALGPTASVLAYDLGKKGFRALDVGHIDIEYEWYLRGAEEPEKITGKFTNEARNGNVVENIESEEYLAQIIAKLE